MSSWRIITGDVRERISDLESQSVQTAITSPPYFGLRDYKVDRQIGLEAEPHEYVRQLVEVFRGVRRVLRDDGTLWLNLGDGYAANRSYQVAQSKHPALNYGASNASRVPEGMKAKDLIGIPWMVAFALRTDGWYLRAEIIWHKPNPMPESVTDRPTRAHEQVFLLSKRPRYFYDAHAIREPDKGLDHPRTVLAGQPSLEPSGGVLSPHRGLRTADWRAGLGRNKRDVWTITNKPYAGAHFATFPPDLVEPMVLAGSRAGDAVLDPFAGAGTTGLVALRNGRDFVGIELNPEYAEIARQRLHDDAPLLNTEAAA